MNISWNLLNEILDLKKVTQKQLYEKLILAGFEVERIKNLPDTLDTIFEINITANRQDTLCIMGIAQEISIIMNTPFKKIGRVDTNFIHDTLDMKTHCRSTTFEYLIVSIVDDISTNDSPSYIKKQLLKHNMEIKNHLIDVINFMNLKWGQNIQVIKSNITNINSKKDNNAIHLKEEINEHGKIITLFHINGNDILISDTHYSFENTRTKITDFEKDTILLISSINKRSSFYNTLTDINKKTKYIKNLSENYFLHAHYETLQLIDKHYIYKKYKTYAYQDQKHSREDKKIYINIKKIHDVLGPCQFRLGNPIYLNNKKIISVLERLQLKPVLDKQKIIVSISQARTHDLHREIDIIEEIARTHSFNKFLDKVPSNPEKGIISYRMSSINKVRKILRSMGLHEIITDSLVNNKHIENHCINLYNPLTEEQVKLRNTLIDNLVQAYTYNTNQGNEQLEGFEIGKIFCRDIKNKTVTNTERTYLSGIMGNYHYFRHNWSNKPLSLSWFQVKGQLEDFFERTNTIITWSSKIHNSAFFQNLKNYLHPKRTCLIIEGNKEIGIFGQINIKLAKSNNISEKTYIFEIDLQYILRKTTANIFNVTYKAYSNYPSIIRDISISIYKHYNIENIINIINKIKKEKTHLIESIEIFDEYYIKKEDLTKKLGLRAIYRSKEKTLTNNEIKELEKYIKKQLNDPDNLIE